MPIIQKRKEVDRYYRQNLSGIDGITLIHEEKEHHSNYAYFPILIEPEYPLSRDELYALLREHNIFARRYFYPLISEFPMYRGLHSSSESNLCVAKRISSKVICLPIFPNLSKENQQMIINIIKDVCHE